MSEEEKQIEVREETEIGACDAQEHHDSGKVVELAGFIWEWTSQPLLPEQSGDTAGSSEEEVAVAPIRIVKVSSGFGRLRVPAWDDSVRCSAA